MQMDGSFQFTNMNEKSVTKTDHSLDGVSDQDRRFQRHSTGTDQSKEKEQYL